MNARPGLCRHRPGDSYGNTRNEKQKKLHMFSFSINMAFEAFRRTKKLISNLLFLKSVGPSMLKSRYIDFAELYFCLHFILQRAGESYNQIETVERPPFIQLYLG